MPTLIKRRYHARALVLIAVEHDCRIRALGMRLSAPRLFGLNWILAEVYG